MKREPFDTSFNFGHPDSLESCNEAQIMIEACSFLEQGEITSYQPVYNASNHVFLVELRNEGKVARAIYKPRRGETPLYDFPDGTLYRRERAAFLTSQALEWFLIPPTVVRDGPYGIGSVQWFVEAKKRVSYDMPRVKSSTLEQVALFDCLVNNADRKAGHYLEGADGRFWLVDHGLTFNSVPKLRTVFWDFSGQPMPKKLVSEMRVLQQELNRKKPFNEALSRLLAVSEMDALRLRLKNIVNNPVFPYPQSRRSVPWDWM